MKKNKFWRDKMLTRNVLRSLAIFTILSLGIVSSASFVQAQYFGQMKVQYNKFDFKILKTFKFRGSAEVMLDRNAQEIKEDHYKFLVNLPFKQIFQLDQKKIYITHGTPSVRKRENVGKYLLPPPLQEPNVTISRLKNDKKAEEADIIMVGHTHRRFLIRRKKFLSWSLIEDILERKQTKFPLRFSFDEDQIILNPGSVGQPRDGTGNASFSIIDLEKEMVEFHDLKYPMNNFYKLARKKCVPEVQDSSFWANKLGYFSKGE